METWSCPCHGVSLPVMWTVTGSLTCIALTTTLDVCHALDAQDGNVGAGAVHLCYKDPEAIEKQG